MNFALMKNLLLIKRNCKPIDKALMQRLGTGAGIGVGFGGQLQQVRCHAPIAGPPRFRLSTAQKLIWGWGSLLIMMIIPFWSLYQLPRWSAAHNNRPYRNEGQEEADAAAAPAAE